MTHTAPPIADARPPEQARRVIDLDAAREARRAAAGPDAPPEILAVDLFDALANADAPAESRPSELLRIGKAQSNGVPLTDEQRALLDSPAAKRATAAFAEASRKMQDALVPPEVWAAMVEQATAMFEPVLRPHWQSLNEQMKQLASLAWRRQRRAPLAVRRPRPRGCGGRPRARRATATRSSARSGDGPGDDGHERGDLHVAPHRRLAPSSRAVRLSGLVVA